MRNLYAVTKIWQAIRELAPAHSILQRSRHRPARHLSARAPIPVPVGGVSHDWGGAEWQNPDTTDRNGRTTY
jgi:hypothetical protein